MQIGSSHKCLSVIGRANIVIHHSSEALVEYHATVSLLGRLCSLIKIRYYYFSNPHYMY